MSIKIKDLSYNDELFDELFHEIITVKTDKIKRSNKNLKEHNLDQEILGATYDSIKNYKSKSNDSSLYRVWLMLGANNIGDDWDALNVGQAKYKDKTGSTVNSRFLGEIIDNLLAMYLLNYNLCRSVSDCMYRSAFGAQKIKIDISSHNSTKKKYYLYHYLSREYKYISFYEVNIDKILNYQKKEENNIENVVYECGKHWFEEARTACLTNACYWNYYNGGLDHIAFNYYKNNDK